MTLEDIGNLGEAIGSLGLLITIVFLVIEMKWSRRESIRQQREQIFQSNLALELSLMGRKVHKPGTPLVRDYCRYETALR